ncbi:hypothetical protein Tco_1018112 [Tanacetum coccineum]|uniref:Uncharacterized protein n=1 Tax=Tanacetum coccineum TaxID=301880 RepID=A0ABQ5FTD0_9ASTR
MTNSAGTLPTTNANASEEEDKAEELIVVPTAIKHTAVNVESRKSSTNSKAEEFLTELQNLKTQENEAYSTGISEDTPEILAFRKELDELAQKHLREVSKNKATSQPALQVLILGGIIYTRENMGNVRATFRIPPNLDDGNPTCFNFLNSLSKISTEPGKPKEVIYSNSKIIQVIKTYWELGHEHKFITEIVARRANECIVSITEPDYKNLNKNDIEDMYLLIMNGKVPDYAETGLLWSLSVFIRSSVIWERVHDFQLGIESYQQKVNLTAPTISFPGVEKHKMFSIIYEPVHGIIYKNSKKEKRVMRHSEIHKFCDATLIRVLEGLKSYNNDVKYGYVQRELTNDEVEYLKLFEEEIEVRLKYRNQMRRWEMYVNGRPLGPRRERPE